MIRLDDVIFTVDFKPYTTVTVKPCAKITWDWVLSIIKSDNPSPRDVVACANLICGDKMPCDNPLTGSCRAFLVKYYNAISQYCNANFAVYAVPQHFEVRTPGEEQKEDLKIPITTYEEHLVFEHTGLTFNDIASLNILQYKMYLADAVKYKMLCRPDGEGIKFLNECYDYMQAELNDIDYDDDDEE